ncbi:MAG: S8 family serine peptidase, partial [Caldilineaceae bacterium]|nr:S8 family serine peptidase [Caldilineaceae bacterium]
VGGCSAPADGSQPYSCNNKLIGVQYFLDGYVAASGGIYDGLFYSGRDDDGHGTHTASTAAGNENVAAAIYGLNFGNVSGMAPRAHVAAYKGLGPLGGVTSDLSAAIEQAVLDGVDVINYSVGSNFASDPWVDADALAYLAAREAGVFVATSAGNAGPGVATIGSPANAPWVMSVGASYFNRLYLSDITISGPGTPPTGLYGATSTPGIDNFNLIDAEGISTQADETDGRCNTPFAPGTFQATDVVLCESGDIATWAKADHVNAGGAGAMIVYNSAEAYDLNSYLYAIPSVRVLYEAGLALKSYVAANAGQVQVSFTQGQRITAPDLRVPVDTVVGFSSRGPNMNANTNQLINVLKPDITAPGIHILAGASPESVTEVNGQVGPYGAQGQLFQLIQGTSMSSPHVAGLGALMAALHPDWSPAQIQSALMTTANSAHNARSPEGDDPATPFDMGAGRVDMTRAGRAGFVLDVNGADYRAADPFAGGDPSALNVASLTDGDCVSRCSWTRVVQSSWAQPVNWLVAASSAPSLTLSVEPTTFTLEPGASQTLTFTAAVAQAVDTWAFGEIDFTASISDVAPAH